MTRQDYPFSFTGNAGEYFRIWIVNVLLTIVTLGIYSAWATVRNKRYFYSNTILDGSSFEYTAEPMTILRGRIVAVVILVLYQAAGFISINASLIAVAVLALLVPALIVLSLRFRMRYTSWRNIQFGFRPNFKYAYLLFGIPALLFTLFIGTSTFVSSLGQNADENQSALSTPDTSVQIEHDTLPDTANVQQSDEQTTEQEAPAPATMEDMVAELGVMGMIAIGVFSLIMLLFWSLLPLWQRLYYQFVANHTQYGTTLFQFSATTKQFYSIYMVAGLIFAGAIAAVVALRAAFNFFELPGSSVLFGVPFLAAFLYARAYITTQLSNTIYGNLELQEIGFRSELRTNRMAWIYFTNAIAVLFSLGLLIPWAQIRMAKYRASTMTLHAENFDDFQARVGADVSAQGAEISDIMDIDIGL